PVARQAHNLKVTGSNPVPATIPKSLQVERLSGLFRVRLSSKWSSCASVKNAGSLHRKINGLASCL
ncbi:hypothetical protein, partial [Sphingomonas sp. Leaf38]|uniref:hypothetical protein n=1 Tax=Sphingomonas sp. Leaf38 TaxID=1736217 RepID=UPI001F1ECD1A